MRIKNDQAGLTLVELLVTILVASIVTLAATTVLLFGLRINNQSTKTSMGQNTVQVLMEALEDVAAEAESLSVTSEPDSWEIENGEGNVLFSYVSANQTIYTGQAIDKSTGAVIGTPFLTGIFASEVTYEDRLLTIDVQTEQDNYSSAIFCRMGPEKAVELDETGEKILAYLLGKGDKPDDVSFGAAENSAEWNFLKTLATQEGSRGKILVEKDGEYEDSVEYYAEWYKKTGKIETDGWGKDTPWCACFISWALAQNGHSAPNDRAHWYADVDDFAKKYFGSLSDPETLGTSGDLIFFNFDEDKEPDHIGAVLGTKVENGNTYVYTIEGNTAGKVAVRKYWVKDPRIIGYGKLFT